MFYQKNIAETLSLEGGEAHHCIHVLRKKSGDHVEITDGNGTLWLATLQTILKHSVSVSLDRIIRTEDRNTVPSLSLAFAPTKSMDKNTLIIEKATELGVRNFYLLLCQHSERRHISTEKLEKVSIAAIKQSGRLILPCIHGLYTPKQLTELLCSTSPQYLLAHCRESRNKSALGLIKEKPEDMVLCIGPEGDFSSPEIETFLSIPSTREVLLSDAILRTETAAIAGISYLSYL